MDSGRQLIVCRLETIGSAPETIVSGPDLIDSATDLINFGQISSSPA